MLTYDPTTTRANVAAVPSLENNMRRKCLLFASLVPSVGRGSSGTPEFIRASLNTRVFVAFAHGSNSVGQTFSVKMQVGWGKKCLVL